MTSETMGATDRADFYLCIARAFLTPTDETSFDGMRELLPADLVELDRVLVSRRSALRRSLQFQPWQVTRPA